MVSKKVLGAALGVVALVGLAVGLSMRKPGIPAGPAPLVVFTTTPSLSGLYLDTPVTNTSGSSQAVQVEVSLSGGGRTISSGTGVFTLAAGESRSYTAVSLVAYGGLGELKGQVWIADATGKIIGSPVAVDVTI